MVTAEGGDARPQLPRPRSRWPLSGGRATAGCGRRRRRGGGGGGAQAVWAAVHDAAERRAAEERHAAAAKRAGEETAQRRDRREGTGEERCRLKGQTGVRRKYATSPEKFGWMSTKKKTETHKWQEKKKK